MLYKFQVDLRDNAKLSGVQLTNIAALKILKYVFYPLQFPSFSVLKSKKLCLLKVDGSKLTTETLLESN